MDSSNNARGWPAGVSLVAILDAPTAGADRILGVAQAVLGAVPRGSVLILDRDRGSADGGPTDRERLSRLVELRSLTRAHDALLLVTGRVDLALACGADGVQLPERGLDARVVRRQFPDLLVARSCHDRAGILAAAEDGADWATIAPVHPPTSKPPTSPALGLDGLADLVAHSRIPLVALGGVTPEQASELARAGACAIAALGALCLASDPGEVASRLVQGFGPPA